MIVLGHQHQRSRNLIEVVCLQHEEIMAKGKEVSSLGSRVAEMQSQLEIKDAELENKGTELEIVKALCGQLEGKLEDKDLEN